MRQWRLAWMIIITMMSACAKEPKFLQDSECFEWRYDGFFQPLVTQVSCGNGCVIPVITQVWIDTSECLSGMEFIYPNPLYRDER